MNKKKYIGGIMNGKKAITFFIFIFLFSFYGCASMQEGAKGFVGVSTKVLEEKRQDALKKHFFLSYDDCYKFVKERLEKKDKLGLGPYIYWEDTSKGLIAIYISEQDTTPVGIFFTQESPQSTLVEVSSASIFAKEEIANRLFKEEKKIDVKKEPDDKTID